jgi:hypothetical protein
LFVEGVRLFVVLLGTALGFWAAHSFGIQAEGLGGILGCLFGYVTGGFFGRFLDRALGVVERRVETTSPAQFIAGTLGAIAGGALAVTAGRDVSTGLNGPELPRWRRRLDRSCSSASLRA